jgi:hypothetical protein
MKKYTGNNIADNIGVILVEWKNAEEQSLVRDRVSVCESSLPERDSTEVVLRFG